MDPPTGFCSMTKPHVARRFYALCLTAFFAAAPQAFAQGATDNATDLSGLVEKFDNWEIRQPPGGTSYFMVGKPADMGGELWLQCERKSFFTVAVSMGGKGGRQGSQKSQVITLQIDKETPRDYNFLVFESFVALATEVRGTSDARVNAFLEAMRDAKNVLTVTYDQMSHDFDVARLASARTRFLQLCGRLPPPQ
jgi:hypothetical protein